MILSNACCLDHRFVLYRGGFIHCFFFFFFIALRRLDLSNNHIKKLPATIGDLTFLSELILHNNHLEAFSEALCLSTLQRTLQVLDLSQNRLQSLPIQFCRLKDLVHLKLDNNKLVCLPFHVGRLTKLRFLFAAHNQLTVLPCDFRKLSLENLDLFGNPFVHPNPLDHTMQLTFPLPLQEIASRAVAELRLDFNSNIVTFTITVVSKLSQRTN